MVTKHGTSARTTILAPTFTQEQTPTAASASGIRVKLYRAGGNAYISDLTQQ